MNQGTSHDEAVAFMRRFNFGTIISKLGTRIEATPLPFVIEQMENKIKLMAHFAKANSQWQDIEGQEVLVIFAQPHAYISPRHYDREENVPTWNYLAVHAYGEVQLVRDQRAVFAMLEKLITVQEISYYQQWSRLSDDYKERMARGIVAFELQVAELQYKEKLSQNKNEAEQKKIVSALMESKYGHEQLLAEYMNRTNADPNH